MNLSRIVKFIKITDWDYLASRNEALLCRSAHDTASWYFKKTTGLSWKRKAILRLKEGEIYHHPDDMLSLAELLKNGISAFISFKNKLIKKVKEYEKTAIEIEKIDCAKLSNAELTKLFVKYYSKAKSAPNFLTPLVLVDKLISKEILDILPNASDAQKQTWLKILAFPKKENIHTKEEKSFLLLVSAYKKHAKNFKKLLEKHLKNYSWIGVRGYRFDLEWKEKDILNRIIEYVGSGKDPTRELSYLNKIRNSALRESNQLIKKLAIRKNHQAYKLINLAKYYAFLRTWRTDVIYRAGFRCKNLFFEIAKRSNFPVKDLTHLSILEKEFMAKNYKYTVNAKEIAKRKKYYMTLTLEDNFFIFSGSKWKKIAQEIRSRQVKKQTEIIGTTAFPGTVRGRAKLVFSGEDLYKVNRGDILVAVMTFPHYISAMEKASAFVTDEGGILCHAAIVAREMGKPCVIGTKIATKIFKDGDMVEVDAERGIVKKIK